LPLKRKIKSLSKGMRAKVSLSLALAHEPELLILDEPTSGLDTLVRREFLEGMVDIAAAGRTVLLSSHQIGEVERVADTVAILHSGKLILVEKLETLKDQIRELNITLAENVTVVPTVTGQILNQRRHRQQFLNPRPRRRRIATHSPRPAAGRRRSAHSHSQLGRNLRCLFTASLRTLSPWERAG
jgi:ABC-2 type transport system ATP-binding protein